MMTESAVMDWGWVLSAPYEASRFEDFRARVIAPLTMVIDVITTLLHVRAQPRFRVQALHFALHQNIQSRILWLEVKALGC